MSASDDHRHHTVPDLLTDVDHVRGLLVCLVVGFAMRNWLERRGWEWWSTVPLSVAVAVALIAPYDLWRRRHSVSVPLPSRRVAIWSLAVAAVGVAATAPVPLASVVVGSVGGLGALELLRRRDSNGQR